MRACYKNTPKQNSGAYFFITTVSNIIRAWFLLVTTIRILLQHVIITPGSNSMILQTALQLDSSETDNQ